MNKTEIILLGCGSSLGVPRIDGYWGKAKKKTKKTIELDALYLLNTEI